MLDRHLIARTAPVANTENQVVFGNRRITVLGPRLFRIEVSNDEPARFCDEATQVVWFRDAAPVSFVTESAAGEISVRTDEVMLRIAENLRDSTVILPELGEVPVFGTETLPGTYRTLDGVNGDVCLPYDNEIENALRIRLGSGVTSRAGVAVLDDSTSLILGADGMIRKRETKETDLYVFAFGHDYRAAIRALYDIAGPTPVIPRFAFGNWWSRYYAYTQREYLDLMDSFAEREIPFTVATVDMDWHRRRNPNGESGWTGYTWNSELLPDYRAFLAELHEKNLHVTLNLHPADGVRWFEDCYNSMAERMGLDPDGKEPVEFDITDEKFINAYFDVIHKPYEHEGVDFWWIDWQQGAQSKLEGLDPLWSLNHYHFLDNSKEKDGLILSRYAGLGSHRYPLGFSGDTYMTWDTLRFLPYFTAAATNAGYTWWSHDIGGHMKGYKDDELYVRSIQFGVFSPINRLHSSNSPTVVKDPAYYTGGAGLIAREFLKLRHAMIPLLYSASVRTAEEGLALIEPMYYSFPDEDDAYRADGQYMFGGQLLAAPITEHSGEGGYAKKEVWLPGGTWIDIFTGNVYSGKGRRTMYRALDAFPLLLREGGFFVLDGAPKGNSTRLPERFKVLIAAGTGSYILYEDEDGKRLTTAFESVQTDENRQTVTIKPARSAAFDLEFRNVLSGDVVVTVNGREISCRPRTMNGFTKVSLNTVAAGAVITVTVTELATASEKRNARILRAIQETEADNDLKARVLDGLIKTVSRVQYEAAVLISGFSEIDKARLLELELDFD